MREKLKRGREKFSNRISSSPAYKKFIRKRDKLALPIKNSLLAFFSSIAPVWNFLFLKTQDPDKSQQSSNEIRREVTENSISITSLI